MTDEIDDVVDAVMTASRAMLSVVARSLAAASEHTGGDTAGDVTLPQYRALVVLAQYGTRRPADLARALTVSASTATRMCDRLVTRGLVARTRTGDDRREVAVALSPAGRALVDEVTRLRRAEMHRLLATLPAAERTAVRDALRRFAEAAGEVGETDWAVAPVPAEDGAR
ncbi:MarR family winged helix-turn-helix transcriptional regulator [Pseudonocardia alni]|uniref:MarR family winged helix-turn-helix transcriptional regulator n=1 Tax=Pseudonocardia alni TaxID=33907 RepID=UPI0027A25E82|nr:MarR family transcriptional regulator [Pseudonocardia alni]